jgi:hypothetical protein
MSASNPLRLNLGSGEYPLAGWVNVDIAPGMGVDLVWDLSVMPWVWPNNSAEGIHASHILEHFSRGDGILFLQECKRVLQPGGTLTLAVPDMDLFIDCRLSGDYSNLGGYEFTSLDDLMGGGDREARPQYRHRYMYSTASLWWTLEATGFVNIYKRPPCSAYDNPQYRPISLYMQADKPE